MANVAIGAPQYGGKKKNNFRLQDGENIYRILPPIGELAAEGVWAVYDSLHWGYKGSKGMRPFKCIEKKDYKTKMIKVQCPECDKIAEKKAQKAEHEARLKAEGKTEEQVAEFVKPLTDWLFSHNLDKKWYVNALTVDGKIGRLAIPHKMYTQLQEVIADLVQKQGVDPIGVDGGVYFSLIRTGKGLQTTHRVGVVEQMEVVNGRPMRMYKPAPLTAEILGRIGNEAYDLKNAVRTLTFDEIKLIVTSNGDSDIVDSVFGSGEITESKAATLATRAAEAEEPEPEQMAASLPTRNVLTAAPAAPVAAAAPAAPAVDQSAQIAALMAQLAALQGVQAPAAPAAPVAVRTAAPVQQTVTAPVAAAAPAATGLSDDDFIKQFGFKA